MKGKQHWSSKILRKQGQAQKDLTVCGASCLLTSKEKGGYTSLSINC